MNALEQAIYAQIVNSSVIDLLSQGADSVFAYSAPENATEPLVIFFQQAGTPVYGLSDRVYTDWVYAIKAICQSGSIVVASEIDEALDELFTDATLKVNGGDTIYCRREASIPKYSEITDGVRYNHAGGSYRLWTGV